jgi:hypothetical protein
MRKCLECEGVLPESRFDGIDSICKTCQRIIKRHDTIEYSIPGNKTIRQAYTELLIAIRNQAVIDDRLVDWESFWLEEEPFKRIWKMLQETESHYASIRSGIHNRGGRL